MQPIVAPPPTGKVAFQQGLIFGLAQAVVASSIIFINTFVSTNSGVSLLLDVLSFFTGLAAYFLAGIMGAKQNGRLRTGVFAGMWTGAIYGAIDLVVSLVLFFQISLPKALNILNNSTTTTTMSPDTVRTIAIATGVGTAIFGLLFAIGLGAGLGALGGLIGRNTSKFKAVPVVPVMPAAYYPGQPAPYPPYAAPAQPGAYPAPEQAAPNTPPAEQIYPEQ